MARVLAADGYRVMTAGNGLEALALVENAGRAIHLVITDVLMPGMTGLELATRLGAQSSPKPVLFVTAGHNLPDLPGPVLWKPFLHADLSAKVRALLDGAMVQNQSDRRIAEGSLNSGSASAPQDQVFRR
jgi:DNA-binding response OmpR family regulator